MSTQKEEIEGEKGNFIDTIVCYSGWVGVCVSVCVRSQAKQIHTTKRSITLPDAFPITLFHMQS